MQSTSFDIDRIVKLVLERIAAAPADSSEVAAQPDASTPSMPAAATTKGLPAPGVLRIEEKLITLASVDGRLGGTAVLQVPTRAVITPAVLDELKQRKIRLEKLSPASGQERAALDVRLLIVVDTTKFATSGLAGNVIASAGETALDSERISLHLSDHGQLAIWATDHPFAAALAAADSPRIRAVQLNSMGDLARAMQEANPNLFIVDCLHWQPRQIQELGSKLSGLTAEGTRP